MVPQRTSSLSSPKSCVTWEGYRPNLLKNSMNVLTARAERGMAQGHYCHAHKRLITESHGNFWQFCFSLCIPLSSILELHLHSPMGPCSCNAMQSEEGTKRTVSANNNRTGTYLCPSNSLAFSVTKTFYSCEWKMEESHRCPKSSAVIENLGTPLIAPILNDS
jgi:hypothetical protein